MQGMDVAGLRSEAGRGGNGGLRQDVAARACELYARLGLAQLDVLVDRAIEGKVLAMDRDSRRLRMANQRELDMVRTLTAAMRAELGYMANGGYGIRHAHVHPDAVTAYELWAGARSNFHSETAGRPGSTRVAADALATMIDLDCGRFGVIGRLVKQGFIPRFNVESPERQVAELVDCRQVDSLCAALSAALGYGEDAEFGSRGLALTDDTRAAEELLQRMVLVAKTVGA